MLFRYIPESYNTPHPLTVSGFDMQMFLMYSSCYLLPKFDSVIVGNQLPITKCSHYPDNIKPLIDSIYYTRAASAKERYDPRSKVLREILNEIRMKLPEDNFWVKVTENIVALNDFYKVLDVDFRQTNNIRDEQMVKNLWWLCKVKFPLEKIIV